MIPLPHVNAMQFYGEDLPEALGFAQLFAGIDGHIATMPEIITARAGAPLDNLIWNRYYTTVSSEYFGLSRSGHPIVIVAHGNSPLNSIESIKKAYRSPGGRYRGLGTVANKVFRQLEAGEFGDVEIIDPTRVLRSRRNGNSVYATIEQAAHDPLLKARLGGGWQTVLENLARQTAREFGGKAIDKLTVGSEIPHCYLSRHFRPANRALAHLLSTSRSMNMHYDGQQFISFDVKIHEKSNGTRFVGIRQGADLSELHRGPELLSDHKEQLLRPYDRQTVLPRLVPLKQFSTGWFSCRPKEGHGMDTGWPEHPVSDITVLGEPGKIVAPYSPFFKYDVAAVIWGAPDEANAYYLGEPRRTSVNGEPAIEAYVYYCHVNVDTTKMCVTEQELDGDFRLQMLLLEQLQ